MKIKLYIRKIWKLSLFAVLFSFCILPIQAAEEDYAPSEILVKFKASTKMIGSRAANRLCRRLNTREIRKFDINNVWQLSLPSSKSVEQAIAEAYEDPSVLYAEPNYIVHVNKTPNDTYYDLLWGIQKIKAPLAWDKTTGSNDVIVAVIDTGVDYTHNDLSGNMWHNPNETPYNGKDDDNNGYVDDYYGYDFYYYDPYPYDGHSHGTHCAGTIAATGNNGTGVAGVCWNTKIMALKFLSNYGYGYISDAVEAIQYAINNGADILSNSWGGSGYSRSLKDAITASNNAGAIFVAAAGNSGSNNDYWRKYPASYDVDNIIAVAATDSNDNLAYFSCYGPASVDLAAPGVYIASTIPGNSYAYFSGTSMACPHVSGVCALILAKNPGWTNAQVKQKLLQSVTPLSSLQGMVLTGGRLNANKALENDSNDPAPDPEPVPEPSLPNDGLQAHWRFNESSGTRMDISGNNNNLSPSRRAPLGKDGKFNNAIKVIGKRTKSKYLKIDNKDQTNLHITGDMTMCAWIKIERISKWRFPISKKVNNYNFFVHRKGKKLVFRNGPNKIVGDTKITRNVWHHVAFIREGATVYLYLDGNLDGSGTIDPLQDTTSNTKLYVGKGKKKKHRFKGLIDELAIWDRALSDTEMQDIYYN